MLADNVKMSNRSQKCAECDAARERGKIAASRVHSG